MSLKKWIVSGAAALALMGTIATAAPQPVTVEKDGTGDYLIAPAYYAIGNWSTELKVVNTNTTRAVAAKVVVRDSKSCDELVDFVIYLTPGDVWTGTLYEENGKVYLKSTDDSMIIGGQVASPTDPIIVGGKSITVNYDGKDPNTGNDKSVIKNVFWHGYVEVFGLVNYSPKDIEQWYHDNRDRDFVVRTTDEACKPLDKLVMYKTVKDGDNLRTLTHDQDVANSDLMGKVTIYAESSDVNGRRFMQLNMAAFGNMSNQAQHGSSTNPIYGTQTSLLSVVDDADKVASLDAALAKDNIYVMYEGDGTNIYPVRVHFTIPTKKYWFSDGSNGMPSGYTLDNIINTPTNGAINLPFEYYYTINTNTTPVTFRDNKEHCKACNNTGTEVSGEEAQDCSIKIREELHFFEDKKRTSLYDSSDPIAQYAFKEGGYIDFNLSGITYDGKMDDDNNVTFKGMPIIPTTFTAKNVQGTTLNNWLYNQYHKANVTSQPSF